MPVVFLLALLYALGLTQTLAFGAFKVVLGDIDTDEASRASPPLVGIVSILKPFFIDNDATLLDILAMVLAQVVTEVINTTERLAAAGAFCVVAKVRLGQIGIVNVLVVALEISGPLEGFGFTPDNKADR